MSCCALANAVAQEICKSIGEEWVWFSDHMALSVDYFIAGPNGRKYEIGTGMSINDSVWGWTTSGEGLTDVSAWGMGALHVRKYDTGEDFQVCVGSTGIKAIELCGKAYLGQNDCPTF
jgi:hypothetical protein